MLLANWELTFAEKGIEGQISLKVMEWMKIQNGRWKKVLVATHTPLVAGSLISSFLVLILWLVCKCLHNSILFIKIDHMICYFHVTSQS